jgi:hypothetical protein
VKLFEVEGFLSEGTRSQLHGICCVFYDTSPEGPGFEGQQAGRKFELSNTGRRN